MTTPIHTAPLFPKVSERLVDLLEPLGPEDWARPVSTAWSVRSVATHLLDGSLRRLSSQRDGYAATSAPRAGADFASLLDYLNGLNADWVRATKRLSPRVLIDLIRWSDAQLAELFTALDPNGRAIWPVAWAGETESENWFDIAREYTEKWHHTQQIFLATGRKSTIAGRELMHPCLDTLMRGLPHGLRNCARPEGTAARVTVTGNAGGAWTVVRGRNSWRLDAESGSIAAATVSCSADDAWQFLMKRLDADEIRRRFPTIREVGDRALTSAVLETVCVMA